MACWRAKVNRKPTPNSSERRAIEQSSAHSVCVCISLSLSVFVCASATVLLTRLKPPSLALAYRVDSTQLEIAAVSPAFRFARRLQVESFAAAFGIWQLQTVFSTNSKSNRNRQQ